MAFVPPAPQLPGEAMLEIFMHPDAMPPDHPLDPDNKFSDGRRLEFLGGRMTEAAYMDVMSQQWPNASADQLKQLVESNISAFMERMAAAYQWTQRVRWYPPHVNRQSLEEAHRLFRTYAGAVFVEHGYTTLRTWIATLLAATV